MNVGELIEKLKTISQDTPVMFPDSEIGYHNVERVSLRIMSKFKSGDYDDPLPYRVNDHLLPKVEVLVLDD